MPASPSDRLSLLCRVGLIAAVIVVLDLFVVRLCEFPVRNNGLIWRTDHPGGGIHPRLSIANVYQTASGWKVIPQHQLSDDELHIATTSSPSGIVFPYLKPRGTGFITPWLRELDATALVSLTPTPPSQAEAAAILSQYFDRYTGDSYWSPAFDAWSRRRLTAVIQNEQQLIWPLLVHDVLICVLTLTALTSTPTWRQVPRAIRAARLAASGRCPACSYDLAGQTSPGCPECGHGRI